MSAKSGSFNLLIEPWIPILRADGKPGRVGIMEVLAQAGRIREIAASNPMDRLAVVRLLLALLYWCKGNPPSDEASASCGALPEEGFSKLLRAQEHFDLLGERERFYQYRAGAGSDQTLSANYLIQEVPTGRNMWHFRHSTDNAAGLCRACCAMGLLRLPLFATSAGRGKPPGINSKPPLYVIPVGRSLADTLWLSFVHVPEGVGEPAWEHPAQIPTGIVPVLTGLTWLPRRVWLDDPGEQGACISCGAREPLIRRTVFAPIGSARSERVWRDPHVLYGPDENTDALHAGNALDAADAAAWQWAQIVAEILRQRAAANLLGRAFRVCAGGESQVHAWVVGFSTVHNDKYLEAVESLVPLPSSLGNEQSAQRSGEFERWQKKGSDVPRRARTLAGKKSSRVPAEIRSALAAVRPHVEGTVSAQAAELLAGGDDAWKEAAAEYRPMLAAVAQSLCPGFTSAAVERRREIASLTPDMRPKVEAAKTPGRKKGGHK